MSIFERLLDMTQQARQGAPFKDDEDERPRDTPYRQADREADREADRSRPPIAQPEPDDPYSFDARPAADLPTRPRRAGPEFPALDAPEPEAPTGGYTALRPPEDQGFPSRIALGRGEPEVDVGKRFGWSDLETTRSDRGRKAWEASLGGPAPAFASVGLNYSTPAPEPPPLMVGDKEGVVVPRAIAERPEGANPSMVARGEQAVSGYVNDETERQKTGFGHRAKNALLALGHSLLSGNYAPQNWPQAVVDMVAGGMQGKTDAGRMGRYGDAVRQAQTNQQTQIDRAAAEQDAEIEYKRARAYKDTHPDAPNAANWQVQTVVGPGGEPELIQVNPETGETRGLDYGGGPAQAYQKAPEEKGRFGEGTYTTKDPETGEPIYKRAENAPPPPTDPGSVQSARFRYDANQTLTAEDVQTLGMPPEYVGRRKSDFEAQKPPSASEVKMDTDAEVEAYLGSEEAGQKLDELKRQYFWQGLKPFNRGDGSPVVPENVEDYRDELRETIAKGDQPAYKEYTNPMTGAPERYVDDDATRVLQANARRAQAILDRLQKVEEAATAKGEQVHTSRARARIAGANAGRMRGPAPVAGAPSSVRSKADAIEHANTEYKDNPEALKRALDYIESRPDLFK